MTMLHRYYASSVILTLSFLEDQAERDDTEPCVAGGVSGALRFGWTGERPGWDSDPQADSRARASGQGGRHMGRDDQELDAGAGLRAGGLEGRPGVQDDARGIVAAVELRGQVRRHGFPWRGADGLRRQEGEVRGDLGRFDVQ